MKHLYFGVIFLNELKLNSLIIILNWILTRLTPPVARRTLKINKSKILNIVIKVAEEIS